MTNCRRHGQLLVDQPLRYGVRHWRMAACHSGRQFELRDHALEPRPGRPRRRRPAPATPWPTSVPAYWYPLYAFIRRKGHDPEHAADLTQEFFARLLEKDYLRSSTAPGAGSARSSWRPARTSWPTSATGPAPRSGGGRRRSDRRRRRRGPLPRRAGARPDGGAALRAPLGPHAPRAGPHVRVEMRCGRGEGETLRATQRVPRGREAHAAYVATPALGLTDGAIKVAVHRLRHRYGTCCDAEIEPHAWRTKAEVEAEIRSLFTALS